MKDDLLTVEEVSKLLKVPTSWIYERTGPKGKNKLPHLKLGKYLRFRRSEIEQYVEGLRSA